MTTRSNETLFISKGFTLIELMIVVAIVGILVAVAVPSYNNYVARAKITEGLVSVNPIKSEITRYFSMNGTFPANNTALEMTDQGTLYLTKYVNSITVGGNDTAGIIQITYKNDSKLPADLRNKKVNFVAYAPSTINSPLKWYCGPASGSEGVPKKYLSAQCNFTASDIELSSISPLPTPTDPSPTVIADAGTSTVIDTTPTSTSTVDNTPASTSSDPESSANTTSSASDSGSWFPVGK